MVPRLRDRDIKLVVIKGNHDVNFIEDFLAPVFKDIGIDYEYVTHYIYDKTLYVHYVKKRARGSYATAITPYLLSHALAFAKGYDINRVVFGHIHRAASQLRVEGYDVITLPSFLLEGDASDQLYDKCIAVIEQDSSKFICDSAKRDYNYLAKVQIYNLKLWNEALIELIEKYGALIG